MFLCDPCHGPDTCHGSVVRSVGQCEKCGKMAACLDCHTDAHRKKQGKAKEGDLWLRANTWPSD